MKQSLIKKVQSIFCLITYGVFGTLTGLFLNTSLASAATTIGPNILTTGTLTADGALKFTSGAVNNYLLKTDGQGNAMWISVGTALANATTSDLAEGSNEYYTDAKVDGRITAQKGLANGLASLDAGGLVTPSELPDLAITSVYTVTDIAQRDALLVTEGDIAIVLNAGGGPGDSRTYIFDGGSWQEFLTSSSGTTALSDLSAAIAANSINNGDNTQTWNWSLSTSGTLDNIKSGITFGDNISPNGSTGLNTAIVQTQTLAGSTAVPLYINNEGEGLSFYVNDIDSDDTPFVIDKDGIVIIGQSSADTNTKLEIHAELNTPNIISGLGSINGNLSTNIRNFSATPNATSIVSASADNIDVYETGFGLIPVPNANSVAMGITSSVFCNPPSGPTDPCLGQSIAGPNDAFFIGLGKDVIIGAATPADLLGVPNSFPVNLKFIVGSSVTTGISDAAEKMRIESSGNVGIGTLSPDARLDLQSDTANALRIEPYNTAAGNTGEMQYMELLANGSNYVGFKAPDNIAGDVTWALPATDGVLNQTLVTDGAGQLSWANMGGSILTTRGDLLTRDGTNLVRLGVGTVGQVLRSDGTDPVWTTLTPTDVGLSNVTNDAQVKKADYTATGALLYGTGVGTYGTLTVGSPNQVLTVIGGVPTWITPSSGFTDPMTTIGDIITRDGTNTTVALGIGTNGQVLQSNGTILTYTTLTSSSVGLGNVTNDAQIPKSIGTAKGDLIAYTASATPTNLAVGVNGQVLTADATAATGVSWITPASGFADPTTTRGDIIYRDSTNTINRLSLGTAGQVLYSDGTDLTYATLTSSNVGLSNVTNDAQVKKADYTATGALLYGTGVGTYGTLTVGSPNQVLTVIGGVPTWITPSSGFTDPMTTRGDLIYRDATNTTVRLARGTAGQVLQSNGTDIAYQTLTNASVGLGNVENTALSTWAGSTNITTLGTITTGTWNGSTITVPYGGTGATTLTGYVKGNGTSAFTASATIPGSDVSGNISGNAANVTGIVAIANGGTGATTKQTAFNALSPLTTKGDLIVYDGTNNVRFPVGANNLVLTTDSVPGSGLKWAAPSVNFADINSGTNTTDNFIIGSGASLVATGSGIIIATSTTGNAATATALAANGANCTAGSYPLGVDAFGAVEGCTSAGTGTVTSVSGTTSRITSTGGATPVIDISSAYVGQTSLTTLGTITTGVWNGTALTDAFVSDTLTSSLFVGSGSTTTAVDLATAEVSGILASTKGGTGVNNAGTLTYGSNNITFTTSGVTALTLPLSGVLMTNPMTTLGDIIYGGISGVPTRLATGTAGQVLQSNGAAAPTWVTPSSGSSAFNSITSGTNTTAAMVVSTGASLTATGSGTIVATSAPAGTLTGATLASGVTASSLTSLGTLTGLTVSGTTTLTGTTNINTTGTANTLIGNNTGLLTLTGKIKTAGTTPTASESGGGVPTLTANSNDVAGIVTSTTTSHTTIIVTFSSAWTNAPFCTFSAANSAAGLIIGTNNTNVFVSTTTTAMTINMTASTTASAWSYHCFGN